MVDIIKTAYYLRTSITKFEKISDMFTGVQLERQTEDDIHSSHCCLVAIGRLQVTSTPNTSDLTGSNSSAEFISRHLMDGKFSFVDQRVIGLLGYSPPELLGKSCFEFFHPEDQTHMKDSFEQGRKIHLNKCKYVALSRLCPIPHYLRVTKK